jgi:NitT/TauT family transport system substrate-binding protein/sulfonate transport system substrate-binding protein
MYFRGINMLKNEGSSPEMIKLYQEFLREWGGMDLNDQLAKMDIDAHPVYDLDEQLALFNSAEGESKAAAYQRMLAEFFAGLQKLTPKELEKVNSSGYVTDKFLKLVEKPVPAYK